MAAWPFLELPPSQYVDGGGVSMQSAHLPQKASGEIKEAMGIHLWLLL